MHVAGDGVHEIARRARCTPGSSSPGISASRSSAKKCCAWRSGSATRTRASRSASRRCRSPTRTASPAASRGDSTVAYAWAYAQALEAIAGVDAAAARALAARAGARARAHRQPPGRPGLPRQRRRASRSASRSSRGCKEDVLRAQPSRVRASAADGRRRAGRRRARPRRRSTRRAMRAQCAALEREVRVLRDIYDEHAGLQDRFRSCGRVTPELAREARPDRARGARERRHARPALRLSARALRCARRAQGAAARWRRRRARRRALRRSAANRCGYARDPRCAARRRRRRRAAGSAAVAARDRLVEGWRGPVLVALETGADGTIRRCHPHDPSWSNWPVLEHAVIGNIVPDFPLINKSFNLSYSGHDL